MNTDQLALLHNKFLESKGVSTDTRTLLEGQIFFALKGDNFNGNQYAARALNNGAALAVVDDPSVLNGDTRFLLVDDVLIALQSLANKHRHHYTTKVIGLTGSNGKTTTKELIASVLQDDFNIVYTQGNLNNHIGVPLSLLQIKNDTQIAIIEMGANHVGEIAELSQIAEPDEGLITNIGEAHLEGFGSIEGVKKGKGELYDFLTKSNGKVYLNSDLEHLSEMISENHNHLIRYSADQVSKDYDIEISESENGLIICIGQVEYNCHLVGGYNIPNILAAFTIGRAHGVDQLEIIRRITQYLPTNKRSQKISTERNTIVLDAYNANPTSMRAALLALKSNEADTKLAILGDMFELGSYSDQLHQEIADLASEVSDQSILVGQHFYRTRSKLAQFKTYEDVKNHLIANQLKGKIILVKASRGMALERLVDLL